MMMMAGNIKTVRAREEDWLARALKTQLELERVWQGLEGEEGYRMRGLCLDNEADDDGDEDGVRVVCLSDTHSTQADIKFSIPAGNITTSDTLIPPRLSQGKSSYTRGTSPDTASCQRWFSSMTGWELYHTK